MESSSTAESQVREVKAVLVTMPLQRQLAFSAWCCERLFPIYAVLSKIRGTHEGQLLRVVIDRLWDHVFGKQLSLEEIDSLCLQCDELDFDSNAEISPDEIKCSLGEAGLTEAGEQSVAQLQRSSMDAVVAVWLSLEACKGDTVENVTKVAQCLSARSHDFTSAPSPIKCR